MTSHNPETLSSVLENSESFDSGIKSFSRSPSLTSFDRWPLFFSSSRRSKFEQKLTKNRDPVLIERRNLVNISKLIVKELIENSLKNGRMLDSDHAPLQHFFIVLEHVLRHGLRPKKGLLGPKKELWDILQIVEKLTPDAQELTNSIRDLPTVKTQMGRARAWLRVALMQKKLADYLKVLVDHRDEELVDYFEPDALMMSDEAIIIVGLMVGLNVIDCNLCIKEEDLDSQQGVIDFSLYLRSSHYSNSHIQGTVSCPDSPLGLESNSMNVVLDQKNYIEELNCHLKATVANLEVKVETLTTSNTLTKEELEMCKNSLVTLKEENQLLKNQVTHTDNSNKKTDIEITDISECNIDVLKQHLENEKKQRIDAEKELHLQMSLKAEMEVAMKLLEKESREKHETIVSLRRQLDDIKMINLEMYKKLQDSESLLKHKSEFVTKLETKNVTLTEALKKTEELSKINEEEKKKMSESLLRYNDQITEQTNTIAKLKQEIVKELESKRLLEDQLTKAGYQTNRLDQEISQLKAMSNEYVHLQEEHHKILDKCRGQERALEELAGQLKKEILKSSALEEVANSSLTQAHWERDNEVSNCKKCKKEFSLTRRKHHCRHCGGIFCTQCSDNMMMLPSSAKPARVCDECNLVLVERYSVVPNN
ncbi:RUN and FYVE domain-containing protein 2 isoform X3 [Daktulosphaira vitifoliae]|uniref:RUN and FYVE domain-containing protein 2 isoform X3 n=1 Tax=Daktulosphaira vitifoliae TaxID=58002 RepID=UPI0021A9D360|nr:RUN and FYVE domain-containing protein 2 isoform X3 [Daktulosphaira vitifoliae]